MLLSQVPTQSEQQQAAQANNYKPMGCTSSQEQQVVRRPLKPVKAFKPIPDRYETLGRSSMVTSSS